LATDTDLLTTAADELADYMDKQADSRATGTYEDAGVLELPVELLDPTTLQVVGNLVAEEMAKKTGPEVDKLMLLGEQGEMLASLQKEYYVISKRHARIGRASRGISGTKHAGSENGAVRNRIKQAGGAY